MSSLETQILISNTCLSVQEALGGFKRYSSVIAQTGAEGYQWLPLAGRQKVAERLAADGLIKAMHEPFRAESQPRTFWHVLKGRESAAMLAVPHMDDYRQLEAIHNAAQAQGLKDRPVIVHPNGQLLGNRVLCRGRSLPSFATTEQILYQPTAELLYDFHPDFARMGAAEIADIMWLNQSARGLGGIALDLLHFSSMRRKKEIPPAKRDFLIQELASRGMVHMVQIGVQQQFAPLPKEEVQKLFMGGFKYTVQGRYVQAAKEAWPKDRPFVVAIEARAGDIPTNYEEPYHERLRILGNGIRALPA